MDTSTPSGLLLGWTLLQIAQTEWLFYIANGVVMFVLLMFSAAISGSEIALFSLPTQEYARYRHSTHRAERISIRLLEQPRMLLATILIFNNFVNVSFVTIATSLTWEVYQTKDLSGFAVLMLTIVVTLLVLFFGELLPKVYAGQRGMHFLRVTIYLIQAGFYIFRLLGISTLLVSTSSLVEKRIKKRGYKIQIEELPDFIDEMPEDETTSAKDKEMLKGIVNFSTTTVKEIMTSRINIAAVEITASFSELIEQIRNLGYSRIPVYRDSLDKIEGVLYIKDLLPYLSNPEEFDWTKLLRPHYFIPENKKIDKLLKEFQERRVHLALVVDEYGGTTGLITMEDIMEEIVGEINDEYDDEVPQYYTKIDDHTYLVEGKISLNDFCKAVNLNADYFDEVRGESHSLGGLMLELFARLPKLNEEISYQDFTFTIVSATNKKIKIVKVKQHVASETPDL